MTSEAISPSIPPINLKNYQFQDTISNYDMIKYTDEAIDKKTGKKIVISDIRFSCDKELRNDFLKELNIISQLNLPGVAKIIGFSLLFKTENDEEEEEEEAEAEKDTDQRFTRYVIAYDFFENGSLEKLNKEYLKSKGAQNSKMNPTVRSKIIFGIAHTMKQLHKSNVIHGNLKLNNILLDDKLEPKITDFRIPGANTFKLMLKSYIVNKYYLAPEVMREFEIEKGQFSVDVYSFAFILYFMFTKEIAFGDKKIIRAQDLFASYISKGMRPNKQNEIPDHYWELINRCWDDEPSNRPTFEEITELLKDDIYALKEFGMETNMDELHEYQKRIENI